ncbi:NifU family protein [Rhodovastum atsumiense]|uniref:NifU family protein n=1 Tax=Rhodovastum atsumiense TaxID=504468 RepID=A0A5M6J0H4_9PROT|nr:NifU family protein [Rhodovastum atsumiense]KAA5614063.1 NifU family protein [Rhodovastum atsumiense]CAH2598879.1 NifU family protein [Rhodovastum atsumiense]
MTPPLSPAPLSTTPSVEERRRQIVAEVIAAARPDVQRDGGDIELVEIAGDRVRVRLTGTCIGCAMAGHTLGALRRRLVQALGEPVRVLPG